MASKKHPPLQDAPSIQSNLNSSTHFINLVPKFGPNGFLSPHRQYLFVFLAACLFLQKQPQPISSSSSSRFFVQLKLTPDFQLSFSPWTSIVRTTTTAYSFGRSVPPDFRDRMMSSPSSSSESTLFSSTRFAPAANLCFFFGFQVAWQNRFPQPPTSSVLQQRYNIVSIR